MPAPGRELRFVPVTRGDLGKFQQMPNGFLALFPKGSPRPEAGGPWLCGDGPASAIAAAHQGKHVRYEFLIGRLRIIHAECPLQAFANAYFRPLAANHHLE
jgi:hypothetical protein